ncbi:nucleotide exchange factor GrpE [Amycolatopsis sp. CA-230715]|uniref:nucleotide exchange factor GrpE n=1 Tax=Amycolatopsis sp. CA-230715 TaxID=2745196 RepID=UPI001C015175
MVTAPVTDAVEDEVPTGQIPVPADPATEGTDGTEAASEPDVEAVPVAPAELEQALADRQSLIQLCLYALDRARSGGVVERIEHGLAGVGVTAVRPDGERFDPARHEAGGAVVTDDAALDGLVAETEVVGFTDREHLLRAPIVTVYTKR